ncbi:aldo/keto reductase [Pleomorphovibrio marinus]|uniref:aldo/keto reductase n=1 Tax=Pleomorphovibrio marinus TaxID=2164132 RepID=UPI000E0A6CF8|nr:aldo/keto reductase [Pleomorphovibrio marinus]
MGNRRKFIKDTASIAAFSLIADWASAVPATDKLGEILPQRQLIRDGQKVTAFCLGGYHLGFIDNSADAEKMVERSMELGVRFFDNARGYINGRAEEYMGKFLTPKYRDQIFLMTKAHGKTGKEVRQMLDESLKALKTDYLDLWQIHNLTSPEEVDRRVEAGVVDAFLEAKEKGKTRYIGFTGHQSPKTFLHFLKKLDELGVEMDTCQMPQNVCDPTFESFQKHVLPVMLEREYGIIAMKTMAGGSMMGQRIDTTPKHIETKDIPDVVGKTQLTYANLHQYVYSLPVSSLCSGCLTIPQLEANVNVLRDMKKLSEADMNKLEEYAAPYAGMMVENYKRIF